MQFNASIGFANVIIETTYIVSSWAIMRGFVKTAGFAARQELYAEGTLRAKEKQTLGVLPGLMQLTGRRRIAIWLLGAVAVLLCYAAQVVTLSGVSQVERLGKGVILVNSTYLWKDSEGDSKHDLFGKKRKKIDGFDGSACRCPGIVQPSSRPSPMFTPTFSPRVSTSPSSSAYIGPQETEDPSNSPTPSTTAASEAENGIEPSISPVFIPSAEATDGGELSDPSTSPQVTSSSDPRPENTSTEEESTQVSDQTGIRIQLSTGVFDNCVRYSGVSSRYLRMYSREGENSLEMFCSDTDEYTTGNEWEMEVVFEGAHEREALPCKSEIDGSIRRYPNRASFYDSRNRMRVQHSGEDSIEVAIPYFSETGTICPSGTARYNVMTFKFPSPKASALLIRALVETNYFSETNSTFSPGELMRRTSEIMRGFTVEEEVRFRTGVYVVKVESYAMVTLIGTCFMGIVSASASVLLRKERINTYNGLSAHCEHDVTKHGNCEYPEEKAEYVLTRLNDKQHIGLRAGTDTEPEPRDRTLQFCSNQCFCSMRLHRNHEVPRHAKRNEVTAELMAICRPLPRLLPRSPCWHSSPPKASPEELAREFLEPM